MAYIYDRHKHSSTYPAATGTVSDLHQVLVDVLRWQSAGDDYRISEFLNTTTFVITMCLQIQVQFR